MSRWVLPQARPLPRAALLDCFKPLLEPVGHVHELLGSHYLAAVPHLGGPLEKPQANVNEQGSRDDGLDEPSEVEQRQATVCTTTLLALSVGVGAVSHTRGSGGRYGTEELPRRTSRQRVWPRFAEYPGRPARPAPGDMKLLLSELGCRVAHELSDGCRVLVGHQHYI